VLVTDPGQQEIAAIRLARIGFDNVLGVLGNPIRTFLEHPEAVERLSRLSAAEFAGRQHDIESLVVVDVRNPSEVALGTIPGALHVSLPELLRRKDELDRHAPTVVFCAGGYRSAIASSLLRSHGFADVSDIIGGYTAWATAKAAGVGQETIADANAADTTTDTNAAGAR